MAPRLRAGAVRFFVAVASLAVFAIVFWAALLAVSSGLPILEDTADQLVWAALKWRLSIILLLIVLSPRRPDLRLLAIDDADARACFRWLAGYLTMNPFNVFLIWLGERLGFAHEAVFGAAFAFGPRHHRLQGGDVLGIAATDRARDPGGDRGRARRLPAHRRRVVALALYGAGDRRIRRRDNRVRARQRRLGGEPPRAATHGIVVGLAVLWQVTRNLIPRLFAVDRGGLRLALRHERFRRALAGSLRALLWILGCRLARRELGVRYSQPRSRQLRSAVCATGL